MAIGEDIRQGGALPVRCGPPFQNGNVALAWIANTGPGMYRVQSTVLSTAGTPVAGIDSYEWPATVWQVDHVGFAALATDIQVYFCDPQSPWQRGSNETSR